MLRAHPQFRDLRGLHLSEAHSLEESRRLQDVGAQMGIPGEAGSPRAAPAPQAGTLLRLGLCLQDAHRLRTAFFPVLKMPPDEGRLVSLDSVHPFSSFSPTPLMF